MNELVFKLCEVLEGAEIMDEHGYMTKTLQIEAILKSALGTDLEEICCNIFHYLDDGDIREKDSDYQYFQNEELEKLKKLLRRSDLVNAKEITFLHKTPDL